MACLEHLTPLGALQTAVLMLAVWWAWIDTAWITNWLNPERTAVRLMLFGLMLAGLVLSASIPKAFEERALAVRAGLRARATRTSLFMLWALEEPRRGQFSQFHPDHCLAGRVGAALDRRSLRSTARQRLALWAIAVGIETVGAGARLLGAGARPLGHHRLAVEGSHMAERCSLFVIIALGESVLVTGATFAGLTWTAEHIGAFLVAFTGSVAMWVIYFNIGAERASRLIASSKDPGRLARNGYTYLHILIVAGIIVAAVGDDLALHHPRRPQRHRRPPRC